MNSSNRAQDRNLVLLILATVILVGALLVAFVVHLASRQISLRLEQDFHAAVEAIDAGESGTATKLWRSLHQSEDHQAHADLIKCGLELNNGDPDAAIHKLEGMKHDGELEAARSLFIAKALIQLDRIDDAEATYQSILKTDASHSRAQRGLKQIAAIRTKEEDTQQFFTDVKPMVDKFCGDCHANPLPYSFPKSHWAEEVKQGFELYKLFDRHDLEVPDQALVTKYFRLQAPTEFDFSPVLDQRSHGPSTEFALLKPSAPAIANPGVAHVAWVSLEEGERPVLLVTDMRNGSVSAFDPNHPDRAARTLAQLRNPCHSTICDLDRDGNLDVLVADLGSFVPADNHDGRVICLKSDGKNGYEEVVLLDNVGRVADVQPGDFDSDGDIDLIVAVFGWRTTGSIQYLENTSDSGDEFQFKERQLDPRHGTIHVPVIDINQDGHLDFIALISQAHEEVVAFINDGRGKFSPQTLYAANDPSFGSSGIQLIDLDQDEDIDVLYTNGDSFDSALMKPYHGVQWLENKGDLHFEAHRVANGFGVYRAVAVDVDADTDLDIVAVSALPTKVLDPDLVKTTDSIICLINDGQQNFGKHVIEQGVCSHLTCDVGDFDQDGDIDFATGHVNLFDELMNMPPIDIWLNQSEPADADK
ncbi:hypothetical protein Poly51_08310 [Rubripirellula tenax]|uniref:FG-GAP repeat protein n=1 Tax=Rubripirellula tenax TaxID=2528015 RepID=A0A5C6FL79_9BACT|nr:VCBS repeat-containing protein [Rubripirellula tenax]TWU60554.1 hypothetical protein Poly51_08310 [Rubripirellula tenax]